MQEILKQSADDLGPAGWDSGYGWGRVNAARAVNLASGGAPVDTMPPSVSFSSPAVGANVSGTISVQLSASDNIGVGSVNLSVDGVLLAANNSAPYSFSWNTTLLSNGTHNLTAAAKDSAGNPSSASRSVTVSNNKRRIPTDCIYYLASAGATVSGNVSVLASASDNVAVTKVALYVDGLL